MDLAHGMNVAKKIVKSWVLFDVSQNFIKREGLGSYGVYSFTDGFKLVRFQPPIHICGCGRPFFY